MKLLSRGRVIVLIVLLGIFVNFYLTPQMKLSEIRNISQSLPGEKETAMNILQVNVKILSQPLRLSSPGMVEVHITNKSSQPRLLNKRLAVGYRNSLSRELFLEVYKKDSAEIVSKQALLYERAFSSLDDYVWIESEKSISTSFNLFEWYVIPPSLSEYEMVVYYQADEALAQKPAGLLKGIYSSERVRFTVMQ